MGASSGIKEELDIKIKNIYNKFGEIFDSKDDFEQGIEQSLSKDLLDWLKNKKNKEYYNNKVNEFWKKIINDRLNPKMLEDEKNNKIYESLLKIHQDEISKIKEVNTIELQKQEQNKQLLEETINQLKEQLKKLEMESENERKKFEDFRNNMMNKYEKNISDIEKRMQEEKDEENKKLLQILKEKEMRKKRLHKLYDEKLKHFKNEKFKEFEKDFLKNEKEFCKEEITKFDKTKINSCIKSFLKNEKIPKFILNYLIQLIDLNKPETKVEHLNILLVGPSGVGKSTLISSILLIEAKAGFGLPQTKKIEFFESENIPFLRLVDSRGIERTDNGGVNETFNNIKNFIQKQIENKESDKYIHIIWYCWTGTRFEESELDLLKKLSQQYKLDTLPIIIVYTNSVFKDETEKARQFVKDVVKIDNEFIDVLAKEKKINDIIIKSKNLDILIEKSINLAKSAVKSALVESLIDEVKEKIKLRIDSLTSEVKDKINSQVKNYLEKIDENIEIKELKEKILNFILNVLYEYLFLTPDNNNDNIKFEEEKKIKFGEIEFSFSELSLAYINNFILDYFNEILKIYQYHLDKYIEKYSKELSNEISLFTAEFSSLNNILLNNKYTKAELNIMYKKEIQEKLDKPSRLAALKNSLIFIIEPFINKIGEYFLELYKQGIEQKKFIDFSRDSIKASFEEIEKKIKEYNESLKEKEKDKEKEKEKEKEKDISGEAPPKAMETKEIKNSTVSEVESLYGDV